LAEVSKDEGPFFWAFFQEVGDKTFRTNLPKELVEEGISK
jgi:hypothetical protein